MFKPKLKQMICTFIIIYLILPKPTSFASSIDADDLQAQFETTLFQNMSRKYPECGQVMKPWILICTVRVAAWIPLVPNKAEECCAYWDRFACFKEAALTESECASAKGEILKCF